MKNRTWYPLDNAAQIFPIVSKKRETNSFRLAATLHQKVDGSLLRDAVKEALKRFPTIAVHLRKGLFWYYIEKNTNEVLIKKEDPFYCESNDPKKQNGYLFNVSYFGNRISLEMSHALTDGNGGLAFLNAILYNYFIIQNKSIVNKGEILTDEIEQLLDESQDSFIYNYKDKIKKIDQESKGFQIKGTFHSDNWTECVLLNMNAKTLKEASKKYNCTITQYLSSVFLYSIYYEYAKNNPSKSPIRLFIPVNARKYFSSRTLRNFVLFIRTNSKFDGDISFDSVVSHVKETFTKELNEEKLLRRIKANILLEKNFFVRFMILPIKYVIVKIVFKYLGTGVNTMSFSNLGVVNIPEDMRQYIDRYEFAIGANKGAPINAGLITFNNLSVLAFTSAIIERKIQKRVIEILQSDGVQLVVTTNDLEV